MEGYVFNLHSVSMCTCMYVSHCNNVTSYFIYCGKINCSCSILLVCHIGAFLIGGPALVPHGVPWVDLSRSNYIYNYEALYSNVGSLLVLNGSTMHVATL